MVNDKDLNYAELILYGDRNQTHKPTGHGTDVMMRSALKILNSALPETAESYDVLNMLGIHRPTISDSIMLAMAVRAQRGDSDAARFLRDTSGQKNASPAGALAGENLERLNLAAMSDDELYALLDEVDTSDYESSVDYDQSEEAQA